MTRSLSLLAVGAALLAGCAGTSTLPGADGPVPTASAEGVPGGAGISPTQTLVENASEASTLTALVAAVHAAGLAETLDGPGPFTVFAPSDAAFEALPAGTVEALLRPENRARLARLLTSHVVPGRISVADLRDGQTLVPVHGAPLRVTVQGDTVRIGDALVTTADVHARNGVAHVIDRVIMPPM